MRGMFWVTKGGDVVESVTAFSTTRLPHGPKIAECRRVGSNAFLGTRRLDRLRPATADEVKKARERWEAATALPSRSGASSRTPSTNGSRVMLLSSRLTEEERARMHEAWNVICEVTNAVRKRADP